jgi:signal transduction histidine kinase/ligand-binding sensor domain-containing protein
MNSGRVFVGLWLAVVLAGASRAFALNPALDINQYAHTAWPLREGFLNSPVSTMAQTPDGYLWLGTDSGLLRFDGMRNVPWVPPVNEHLPGSVIFKLLVARDGRLWIGTDAGLAAWKDGHLVTYPEFTGQIVAALVEDAQGTVWAGTMAIPSGRLCTIRREVRCAGEDGRFGRGVLWLYDDRGTLWVAAMSGLWRWTPGEPVRYPMRPSVNVRGIIRVDDGPLLIATSGGVQQLLDETLETYRVEGLDRSFDAERFLLDGDGGLWIGTAGHGLVHVHRGRVDRFAPSDGLSGDLVNALYEDREGNVWVATNEGLDRFREFAITTISARQGLPSNVGHSVLPARDGSVWIGSPAGLTRWKDGTTRIFSARDGLSDAHIGSIFEQSTGRLLVSTGNGVDVSDGDRFRPVHSLTATQIVYAFVETRPGDVWISDIDRGLLHLIGEDVVQRIPWSALGRDDHATAGAAAATHGLWLGFYKGGIAHVSDGAIVASFAAADGLGRGRVSQLRLDRDGALWVATAGGLSRVKDTRIATLTTKNGLPCEAVHWSAVDMDGSLWMLLPCGLVRITATELAAWVADASHAPRTTRFGSSDGVRVEAGPIGFAPTVASLSDGRLWFASPTGVGVVDPRRLPFNALPPPVHIEQVLADREPCDPAIVASGTLRLPPRVRDLQIDYTALSLVVPEKVRFRYMLEGHDRDWQDAGTRRQAFYNDLPARKYRFRVTASNNSGVWNQAGAVLDFSVAPAYYQTTWFMVLSTAALIALVWSAHRIRLRIVEKHQGEISALNERLMNAQEQERIRIAGELHDGVMQEMQAVTMMLGAAKRRVAADAQATATIDKAQQKLVQAGTDLRQLSHDLHPPLLQEAGLPTAVAAYCEQFSAASGLPVACEVDDAVRELSRGAALALFRVVQEALGNAAKHAKATQISVHLARSDGMVSLRVADNGVGIDQGRLASGGGLGLIMMRERASQLNGRFEVESAHARGTTIRVVIPFR